MSVPPTIEILPHPPGMFDVSGPAHREDEPSRPYKNKRLLLFIAIFTLGLAVSLPYVWLRKPIYQTTASLLTVAPEEAEGSKAGIGSVGGMPSIPIAVIERAGDPANPEHVTLQRQILLGVPVFEEAKKRLYAGEEAASLPALSLEDMRNMLNVVVIREDDKPTNLVGLQAQGPQPAILAPLVNAWIDAYQALREQTVRNATNTNYAALAEESKQLDKKIAQQRKGLEDFRETYDILTRTDSDNTPMMRLKGLNEALNRATDETVKAKAKLDAVRAAIAKGEPVMPPEDAPGLTNLERRAQELREMLKDSQRRFTPTYMMMNPQMRQIPEKLAQVESAIKQKQEYGKRAMLSQTEQAYAAANQSVAEIRQKIVEMKRESAEFTNRFAEQQRMDDDLKRLEAMHRDVQARLAHIESRPEEPYPPLQVVERAYPPTQPFWPHYWRDTGIGLVASILAAFLCVWFYDYLTRPTETAPAAPAAAMPSFQFYSVQGSIAPPGRPPDEPAMLPPSNPNPSLALESPFPRELTAHEIHVLLDAADANTRLWLHLLLLGLSPEEIASLDRDSVDVEQGRIRLAGVSPRLVDIPENLRANLLSVWQADGDSVSIDAEEVSARVACAAVDSGLPQPDTIDASTVRHTYIAFLVRQGIRLAELERITGRLAAKNLALYGRLSPSGPGLPADKIAKVHPALASLTQ